MFLGLDHEPRCTPTRGALASSEALLEGPTNGRPRRHQSSLDFKVIASVAQGGYDWELSSCGFFRPGTTELKESGNEGWEARFMVFAIIPGLVPSHHNRKLLNPQWLQ
jgi:hypothetical protein